MHITELNRECLLHLFSFLDKTSRRCLSQTCHSLMDVYQDPVLWPILNFSCPGELNKKNFILGTALRSLSICWYSSRVKICNIEDWWKTPLQKSMCSQHQNIVSDFLLTVSERCLNLQSLTLYGCAHVHDDIIIEILTCCSNLRSLKLENCSGVTDKMLMVIPVVACNLKTLHVNFCRNITHKGLYFLQQFCPGLMLQADRSAGMVADRIPEDRILFQKTVRKLVLS
ncbi:F-box and leucine-rich protein 22 [Xenopus tropicalis]|uniref:F-box and leucine-rich protein 22 n=1 Tax=Xenopus tropicalis TaxID=8364 RepID=F6TAM3_XENTR|nr:F-box and leucine-rich protein 22 [Xenopus tropicalis]XP_004916025.1 F-box and leucine-rich protein 22 [Xenopus tropicalis]|eukprot:XP_002934598.1 PREDICTED: F-box and leucine-rich protein 22 [Xenopus tropicalis]